MTSTEISTAVRQLRDLSVSAARSAALRAAVELGLADAIGEDAVPLGELAAKVGVEPKPLRRLLRALTGHGVFEERPGPAFGHSEMSALLREDAADSLRYLVLWSTEPWTWELWPRLASSVRTGKPAFAELHGGADFFGYLRRSAPESAAVLDRAMTQSSSISERSIVDLIDLADGGVVADICGGRGHLLAALLERYPRAEGILFDTPEAIADADERLTGPFADRAVLVGGDCRVEIPVKADLYVLKNILEWDAENAIATMRNVCAAGGAGKRVVVIGNMVDASPEVGFTTAIDLLLLLNVGGGRRTTAEVKGLVERGGLKVLGCRPVDAYLAMFDCVVDG